jgi:asparagine synthase (glutamine-hydrolysing)
MCGIIGTIGDFSEDAHLRLQMARDQMEHRGPDDAGLNRIGPALFGFRRLAILDLTPAGHQPMLSADEQVALVFNGEIYNFQEIKRDLQQSHHFRSNSDTEVILNAYLEWGWEIMLRRIDGMFGIAIWDNRTQTLYAARDRVGKKPFFYSQQGDQVCFSSTLNSLRGLLKTSPEVDPVALDAYLAYQAVPAPMTIYQGISQLPPAHQLIYRFDQRSLEVSRYWEVRYDQKLQNKSEEEILNDLDDLVRQAVRKRLMSDVPLGAFLSGGVDSSLVVAMMAQEMKEPVNAIVIGFNNKEFDERRYARQVAEHLGKDNVNLSERVLDSDSISNLPEIIWHYGQPLSDVSIIPTYHVAKAAKESVTVVLNGDGGDEIFGGYSRPIVAGAAEQYRKWVPSPIRSLLSASVSHSPFKTPRSVSMLMEAGQRSAIDNFVYDRAFRSHRSSAYAPSLSEQLAGFHPDSLYRSVWESADGVDDVDRALYGDFKTYLPDQLLTKMDTSTMAASLEARSPLLDKNLIEYSAMIPNHLRIKGYTTKYLLKKLAARYVPKEVLYRRKRGFVMPTATWLRGDLMGQIQQVLTSDSFRDRGWFNPDFVTRMLQEHQSKQHNWSEQIWTLLVLEVWAKMMLDNTLSRTDPFEALR